MNTSKPFDVQGYLSRLARGGVCVYALGNTAHALPVMESGEPVPAGTLRTIEKHSPEIAQFFDESYIYPFLTPGELEITELVLDTLEPEELERYWKHKKLYSGETEVDSPNTLSDSRTTPFRSRGASKEDTRQFHPPYHETPQDKRLRGVVEGLERLSAATVRVSESQWSFESGAEIKWVKRVKPDGTKSIHFIAYDQETECYRCDCQYKNVRPNDACVHELARTSELERRSGLSYE